MGTRADAGDNREVSYEEVEEFASENGWVFYETSSITGNDFGRT